jgi:hypothetical protein
MHVDARWHLRVKAHELLSSSPFLCALTAAHDHAHVDVRTYMIS